MMTPFDFSEKTVEHIVHNLVDRNMIGRTITGEPLYRMPIEDSGGRYRNVIVNKLENENRRELEIRCQSEENTLGMIRHDNIAVLLGSIWRHDMILLVYEDMENGSLDEWLHHHHHPTEAGDRRRPPLGWPARRSIATDVARGICYMHHECNNPIVHRNIKPADIWLDRNLKAKIAGFGVARINVAGLGRPLVNAQLPTGAFGYTAPEYTTMPDQVTEKVDVYSFGVILLELVTGRLANGTGVNGHLATWAQRGHGGDFSNVVDTDMPNRAWYMKEMKAVFKLGVECTAMEPKERPSMETVLRRLSRCGDSWWGRCICFK
ncbi:hypothetical protein E2562_023464 [Oryza meyeriana var. granulata]|uniref:Protein kinase domain-containing protein n=1 Tax=Oryza meyeriana var. granulata TaxID=110450 RepID=A0A6G1FBC2_9ORYZ|nr:hypothetical protein E2562_023464 [Oryza meyeriana var. granulata]